MDQSTVRMELEVEEEAQTEVQPDEDPHVEKIVDVYDERVDEDEVEDLKYQLRQLQQHNSSLVNQTNLLRQENNKLKTSNALTTVIAQTPVKILTDIRDWQSFFQQLIASTDQTWNAARVKQLVSQQAQNQISLQLKSNSALLEKYQIPYSHFSTLNIATIDLHILNEMLRASKAKEITSDNHEQRASKILLSIRNIKGDLDGTVNSMVQLINKIDKILQEQYAIQTDAQRTDAVPDKIFRQQVKELTKTLIAGNPDSQQHLFNSQMFNEIISAYADKKFTSFNEWYHFILHAYTTKAREIETSLQLMGLAQYKRKQPELKNAGGEKTPTGSPPAKKEKKDTTQITDKKDTHKEATQKSNPKERNCNNCGHNGPAGPCPWWYHPNINRNGKVLWKDSAEGKLLASLKPPVYKLDKHRQYDPDTKQWSAWPDASKGQKGPVVSLNNIDLHTTHNESNIDVVVLNRNTKEKATKTTKPIRALVADGSRENWARRNANDQIKNIINNLDERVERVSLPSILFDTGSDANFVSKQFVTNYKLQVHDCQTVKTVKTIHGETRLNEYVNILDLQIVYKNNIVNVRNKIFYIVSDLPFPILIGLPLIREYDLTTRFKSYFTSQSERYHRSELSRVAFNDYLNRHIHKLYNATLHNIDRSTSEPGKGVQLGQLHQQHPGPTQTGNEVPKVHGQIINSQDILAREIDNDHIDEVVTDPWTDYFNESQDKYKNETQRLRSMADNIIKNKYHIAGSPSQVAAIQKVLNKYTDVFRETISNTPAKIPPFEINVNKKEWEKLKCNKGYVRPQWSAKMTAIKQFIDQAARDNLIDSSQASHFSQVLLTPKTNGDWRFCIDYRALNTVSEGQGWPIPNIKSMLQRIGDVKPEIFAVMDLTSGYHQAPLSKASQEYTAFITHMGLYRWLRVPMGLKGAPSYFQHQMVSTVLPGLVHTICEIYIDDICVYAKNIKDFCTNLDKVLERLRKHNISLNPKKCHFGLQEVEYVGHVIDREGLSFSSKKLDKVSSFRRPDTQKSLHEFLGLTSYFRDHIKNHSEIVHPLQQMLAEAQRTKTKKLKWNDKVEVAWNNIKEAVINCPKLHWLQPGHPVYVNTDASDYGIGAYLYQDIDGIETPIAFISKTLNKVERKWSTIEKEAYAIFYSLTKWENYLRDCKFTLRTDHANLTYINNEGKQKVQRWKLALQEYDFYIEHIKGVDNIVADRLSRFCEYETEDDKIRLNNIIFEGDVDHIQNFHQDKPQQTKPRVTRHMEEIHKHVIPSDRYKIISACHNTAIGHFGVQETINKVRKRLDNLTNSKIQNKDWSTTELRRDVTAFIHRCPCCQKMAILKRGIHTHGYTTATWGIFENIAIDVIMGLPMSNANNSNIMVIIDTFSRYIELYPMKELTAIAAVKALKQWTSRYGLPRNILTDNASQFRKEYEATLKILGITNEKIHPYSHQENAIIERANREIIRHLRNIIYENKILNEWEDHLPDIMRIKNATRVSSTGVAPAELVFGSAYRLEAGILYPHKIYDDIQMSIHDYLLRQYNIQQAVLSAAYKHQDDTDAKHLAQTAADTEEEFDIDTYVLAKYENDEHAAPSKLHPKLRGPYQIVEITRRDPKGTIYTCRNLATQKLEDFHVKLLVHYEYDKAQTNPDEAAMADSQMFEVESVLDHIFENKKQLKSKMKLKIKWVGYAVPTWETYTAMSRVEQVHHYLRDNGFIKFINPIYLDPAESQTQRKRPRSG